MFRSGGPRPWQTHVGDSHLEEKIARAQESVEKGEPVATMGEKTPEKSV